MKTILYSFVLVLFLAVTACNNGTDKKDSDALTQNNAGKDKFTDTEQGFRIKFPGNPTKNTETVTIEGMGDELITDFTYSANAVIYTVAVSPQSTTNVKGDADMTELLISLKDSFCADLQLQVSQEKETRLDGNAGIFFKANSSKYYTAVANYIVNGKLYQVAIITSKGEIPQATIDAFIGSFEILK